MGYQSISFAVLFLCSVGLCACAKRSSNSNSDPVASQVANEPVDPPATDAASRTPVAIDVSALAIDASPTNATFEHDGPADEFVDLAKLESTIVFDMRYATTNNFTKTVIYPVARCLLRRAVANAVVRAQKKLWSEGYALKIWDCYRPFSVQETFWQQIPDPRYVAKPVRDGTKLVRGSKHNRGAAIDVSLLKRNGKKVKMPTDHDDFSKRAHRNAPNSATIRGNVTRLTDALVEQGFTTIASEWWHFDGADWRGFPLADEPL